MTAEEAVSRIKDALQRLTQEFHTSAADYDENGRLDAEALAVVRRAAALAEREACAVLVAGMEPEGNWMYADDHGSYWESDAGKSLAEAARRIRSRP